MVVVNGKKHPRLDYRDGLQFACRACGKCCRTRGKYSFVYVSLPERRRLAKLLDLPTRAFTRQYCLKTDGSFHLRDDGTACIFARGAKCLVYAARPEQCRTWPFWPENMYSDIWREIGRACPGIGRGQRHTRAAIRATLRHDRLWAGKT